MVSIDLGAQADLPPPSFHRFRYLKWRFSQFKSPAQTYSYRARVDPPGAPSPPTSTASCKYKATQQPKAAHQRRHSLPSPLHTRGHISPTPSTPSLSSHCPTGPKCLHLDTPAPADQKQDASTQVPPPVSKPAALKAQAVVMQPKAPLSASRRPTSVPSRARMRTLQLPFDYPDPTQLKGNISFDVRLMELSSLERDTVRQEEQRRRWDQQQRRARAAVDPQPTTLTRPSSARNHSRHAPCPVAGGVGDRQLKASSVASLPVGRTHGKKELESPSHTPASSSETGSQAEGVGCTSPSPSQSALMRSKRPAASLSGSCSMSQLGRPGHRGRPSHTHRRSLSSCSLNSDKKGSHRHPHTNSRRV